MVSADAFLWNPETNKTGDAFATATGENIAPVLESLARQISNNPAIGFGEVIEITVHYHGDQA